VVIGQLHAPTGLPLGKAPPPLYNWIGGWVDPRASLDDLEKRKFFTLPGLEVQPLSRPARSQSLYRLRYPGSNTIIYSMLIYLFPFNSSSWGPIYPFKAYFPLF
jgi:hypothetical protein